MNKNEIISIIKRNGWLTYDKPLTTDSKHSRMTVEDAEWEESKHKRAKNGQFTKGSGGGGGGGGSEKPSSSEGGKTESGAGGGSKSSSGGSKSSPGGSSSVAKEDKFVIDSPEARKLYEDITSGKYYDAKDLINHPVVKQMDEYSSKLWEKYGSTKKINTPERQKMREEWKKDFLSMGSARSYKDENGKTRTVFDGPIKKEHKAVIAIGLPAAGKSTRVANPVSEQIGAFILDSDEVKQRIPEFRESNGGAAASVHGESKDILASAFSEFLQGGKRNGENLVVPVIGDNLGKLQDKWIQKLEDAGYDVEVKYQDADPKESLNRVIARGIRTGRVIPTDVVFEYGDKPRGVFEALKKLKNRKGKPYVRS